VDGSSEPRAIVAWGSASDAEAASSEPVRILELISQTETRPAVRFVDTSCERASRASHANGASRRSGERESVWGSPRGEAPRILVCRHAEEPLTAGDDERVQRGSSLNFGPLEEAPEVGTRAEGIEPAVQFERR
jgi:hypothetical protein